MLALRTASGFYRPKLVGTLRFYQVNSGFAGVLQSPAFGVGGVAGQCSTGFRSPSPYCGRYPLTVSSSVRLYANEPAPPNLPDRQQVEKCFFRCVAFIWDVGAWIFMWSKRNFQVYVINNPTVQEYYKKLLQKMEQSKKG